MTPLEIAGIVCGIVVGVLGLFFAAVSAIPVFEKSVVPLLKKLYDCLISRTNDGSISVGLWGDLTVENSFKHKGFDGIKTIKICSSTSVIYSIEVVYTKDGEPDEVKTAGGRDGGPQQETMIVLRTGEYITKVSGYYGPYLEDKKVRSLTFTTNMDMFGPYGETVNEDDETATSFYVEGGMVVGFYGKAENYISAIGLYVLPLIAGEGNDNNRPIKVGLWGKKMLEPFDHCEPEGIQNLTVTHDAVIDCITVIYRNNDEQPRIYGDPSRGDTAPTPIEIVFEDGEYINKVVGYYGRYRDDEEGTPIVETITGLNITTTNGRTFVCGNVFETYDNTPATPFNVEGGRIVGFHGSGKYYINSIGFYILP